MYSLVLIVVKVQSFDWQASAVHREAIRAQYRVIFVCIVVCGEEGEKGKRRGEERRPLTNDDVQVIFTFCIMNLFHFIQGSSVVFILLLSFLYSFLIN